MGLTSHWAGNALGLGMLAFTYKVMDFEPISSSVPVFAIQQSGHR